jgi:hypothetical protein
VIHEHASGLHPTEIRRGGGHCDQGADKRQACGTDKGFADGGLLGKAVERPNQDVGCEDEELKIKS